GAQRAGRDRGPGRPAGGVRGMSSLAIEPRPGSLRAQILAELLTGRELTSMRAWQELGVSRLAADIYSLRCMGWEIEGRQTLVRCRSGSLARVTAYRLTATGAGESA